MEELYSNPIDIWRPRVSEIDECGIDSGHHVAEENRGRKGGVLVCRFVRHGGKTENRYVHHPFRFGLTRPRSRALRQVTSLNVNRLTANEVVSELRNIGPSHRFSSHLNAKERIDGKNRR
ncbi:hypothetical protein [Rhizobium rhizogenes]|uniref:hypothetical protein n=1 Tax=Rhizobium rhizogenes TaxID=359 RepID=UPI0015719268|nr:hypothetical protein [Rhizobium rhizogenes]NTI33009.1 hypothetical protein [Rhizobium rhizogenes]